MNTLVILISGSSLVKNILADSCWKNNIQSIDIESIPYQCRRTVEGCEDNPDLNWSVFGKFINMFK